CPARRAPRGASRRGASRRDTPPRRRLPPARAAAFAAAHASAATERIGEADLRTAGCFAALADLDVGDVGEATGRLPEAERIAERQAQRSALFQEAIAQPDVAGVAGVGTSLGQVSGRGIREVALRAEGAGDACVEVGARRPAEGAAGIPCGEVARIANGATTADAEVTTPAVALAERICQGR